MGLNGTLLDEISNYSKMMYEFSCFINALNCSAFVLDNGSKVLFCFQWINTNKKVYICFLLSQLPLYAGVTGTTVQLQNVIDTFVFLRLVNTFNAVKVNCLGVEHYVFNIPRPSRQHMGVIFND